MSVRPKNDVLIQQDTTISMRVLDELQAIREDVQGSRGQMRDLRTILMGDGDTGETIHGRIPQLEMKVRDLQSLVNANRSDANRMIRELEAKHETRLKILEESGIKYNVYGHLLSLLGGASAGMAGAIVSLILPHFFHH